MTIAHRDSNAGSAALAALEGITALERGWLSSNNTLLHGEPGEGATLVDTGHCEHAAQTLALVRHALAGERLARVVNTHLHSDHCGGNASLQREWGVPVHIPPGLWQAALAWDDDALSYVPTRQRCERFRPDARIVPGDTLGVGGRRWQVLAAPGHDPHSVMLFDPGQGVLISADALWEDGFGIVFPELEGEPGFDAVASTLDVIDRLPVQWVLPGHGAPFSDVKAALARARSRLAGFRADPSRHARHAARALLKFHLLEERRHALAELREWFAATPVMERMWRRLGEPQGSPQDWCEALVTELVAAGVLALRDGVVHDE